MNTAQDVIDYLLTTTGGGAQDGEHRAIRAAVVHGVREVFQTRDWLWHTKTGTFTTVQAKTTATLTKDSSVITVADPSIFIAGRIVAPSSSQYFSLTPRVVSVSGTSVTLDRAAVSSATNVIMLVQTFYDLPANVKDIDALMTETVGTLHFYVTPQEWQQLQVNTRGAGEPYYYTIMRSDVNPDRYQVRFVGVPTDGTVVFYTFRYIPDAIRLMGFEASCRTGTVTAASNSTTVTLSGSTFPTDMSNTAIRFGTATNDADSLGSLTPYVYERRVISRDSDTTVTVDSSLSAMTGVKYAVSNIIDASPQMWTAILSAAEMWYARVAGRPAKDSVAVFNRDLRLAMENDVIAPMSGRQYMHHYPTPRTLGYHSPLGGDIGIK
jgi:hypothetical protein